MKKEKTITVRRQKNSAGPDQKTFVFFWCF